VESKKQQTPPALDATECPLHSSAVADLQSAHQQSSMLWQVAGGLDLLTRNRLQSVL